MKNKIAFAFNVVLTIAILGLFALKLPTLIATFKIQGTQAADFAIKTSQDKTFDLTTLDEKKVLIFWATWCPPCESELSRIDTLVKEGRIKAESILAIAINDDPAYVDKVGRQRGYSFPWATDAKGEIADRYNVKATPTIAFVDGNKKITWMTTGFSPLLSFRLTTFLD